MATSTKIQLVEFNENAALNGALLCFSSDGTTNGKVDNYVLNFKLNDNGSVGERYSAQVQKVTYYFNADGECSDGNYLHNLFIIDATIEETRGTSATRVGTKDTETIDIGTVQPREYFAMYALQGMLTKFDNPLLLDDAQITLITTTAFKIAQGMMQASADSRNLTKPESEGGGGNTSTRAEVDISDSTNTDKLLGNLVIAIDGLTKEAKKFTKTVGEGEKATTVLNIPNLEIKEPIPITNKEEDKFKVDGGGGSGSLTRDDVNDTGSDITDVLVYNTGIGIAAARSTISNFANKVLSVLGLGWLLKKGETSITDASSFFSTYKEDIATLLEDKFDSKGSAAQALNDAKAYTDSKITNN